MVNKHTWYEGNRYSAKILIIVSVINLVFCVVINLLFKGIWNIIISLSGLIIGIVVVIVLTEKHLKTVSYNNN